MQAIIRRILGAAVPVLWCGGILSGVVWLHFYKSIPGQAVETPARWTNATPQPDEPTQPKLLMFVHPHCPCSRAAMGELARILSLQRESVTAEIVLVKPHGVAAGWEQGFVSAAAERFPGVRVRCDEDGNQAKCFGAYTSGHVVLYDADGKLQFSGGITTSRGHAGGNAGTEAILTVLNGEPSETTVTPVFGCPLFAPEESNSATHGQATKCVSLPISTRSPIP